MTLPPLWAVTGALALAGGVACYVQTARLGALQAEYGAFKTQIEVLGREAEREKKAKEDKYRKDKEKADESLKKLTVSNQSLARSLHNKRASESKLSGTTPGAASALNVCFARTEFERATGLLDAGLSQVAEQCDQRIGELNIAKSWAQETMK